MSGNPRLSVIVPAYNGEDRLLASLASLGHWLDDLPFPSELVLVDDCSGPAAATIMAEYAGSRPITVYLRNERNSGKGASVARGMLAASGDLRVFTDAD